MLRKITLAAALAAVSAASVHVDEPSQRGALVSEKARQPCITKQEMIASMDAWGGALTKIGAEFRKEGCIGAVETAKFALDVAYGYNASYKVLFKPTLTTVPHTFRPTYAGALSYFVGPCLEKTGRKDDWVRQDGGFALGYSAAERNPKMTGYMGFKDPVWSSFDYMTSSDPNDGLCDTAIAMGKLTVTSVFNTSVRTTVDKTFAYKRAPSSNHLLLVTHHSSVEMERLCLPWCNKFFASGDYKGNTEEICGWDRCSGCLFCDS